MVVRGVMFRRSSILVLVAAAWAVSPALAGEMIPIENPGFEVPPIVEDDFTCDVMPGWELYNPDDLDGFCSFGNWRPPVDPYEDQAPEGLNIGWIYFAVQDPGIIGMSQTLDATLEAGTIYQLFVRVGNASAYWSEFNQWFYELEGFPGYRVELLAGENVIAMDDNSQEIVEGTFGHSFIEYIVAHDDPNVGLPIGIRLINLLDGPGKEVDFDDVILFAGGCVRDPDWICDGDVDGDGQVNPVDSGLVQAAFGSVDGQDLCNYDVDCDGQINPVDAGIVQSLFGTCEEPRAACP